MRDLDSQTLGFARFKNMSFAVIRTGGKQYRVTPGATVTVEKLAAEPGENVEFNEVLVRADGDNTTVGQPLIEGARVSGVVLRQSRGARILVYKKKRRKNYRRRQGHRQYETTVRITDIA